MITGAYMVIYSTQPEADRAFLRDHLNLPYVDAGDGWLIFGLQSAEVAVHPPAAEERVQEPFSARERVQETPRAQPFSRKAGNASEKFLSQRNDDSRRPSDVG